MHPLNQKINSEFEKNRKLILQSILEQYLRHTDIYTNINYYMELDIDRLASNYLKVHNYNESIFIYDTRNFIDLIEKFISKQLTKWLLNKSTNVEALSELINFIKDNSKYNYLNINYQFSKNVSSVTPTITSTHIYIYRND